MLERRPGDNCGSMVAYKVCLEFRVAREVRELIKLVSLSSLLGFVIGCILEGGSGPKTVRSIFLISRI